eukprot:gene10764-7492_t
MEPEQYDKRFSPGSPSALARRSRGGTIVYGPPTGHPRSFMLRHRVECGGKKKSDENVCLPGEWPNLTIEGGEGVRLLF